MRVALSADQQAMREATVTMLAAMCTTADIRAAWASDNAMSRERWGRMAELGLTGLTVPVALGGLGATEVDVVAIFEETGYVALPEPVIAAAVVAHVLAEAAPAEAARRLPAVAAGDSVVALGFGADGYVNHATSADFVLVIIDDAMHVVDAADLNAVAQPSVDGARRLCRIEPPAGEPVARDAAAAARAVDRATLFTAAQLVGLGRRCLDLSVAYARERHQFGRPIGSYQALKHRMADDWTALEFARPMVWRAAWSLTHDLPDATLHVSAAKAATNDAASRAARTAVQVHGALGYTFACDVQLFLKRTLALTNEYGDTRHHRRRLAEVLRTRDIARVP